MGYPVEVFEAFYLLLTYTIASIPIGVAVSTLLTDTDVMLRGSRNIGATNVLRVVGPQYGAATLIGDVLKGLVPVWLAGLLFPEHAWFPGLVAIVTFVGHCWSCYLDFRGGKGVATAAGAMAALAPLVLLICVGIWGGVVAASHKSSLGSLVATLAMPLLLWFLSPQWLWVSAVLVLGIVVRHRENITRLIAGKET